MKKLFPFFLSLLALAACASEYEQMLNEARRAEKPGTDRMLYATMEDAGGGDAKTKVYADVDMRVLWNANDVISAFLNYTYNQPYRFKGNDGDNAGGFTKVQTEDELITGNELDHIYAVYPYDETTSISNRGILSVALPAEQHYLAHSFGKGANTMVSVTDDNMLRFKNAGGYLSFKFYGEGVSVKSITLKGNNQEKLAGKASVTMSVGGTPAVAMQNDATQSVTLVCDEPVILNASAENFTEFWFVIPPTTFEQGFTVTVTDVNGGEFTKTTSKSITVSRNNLSRMAPMEVVSESSSHQAVDLGLPSGLKWATCNVGADSPEEYGDYFAWGETNPKENYSWSTYKWCNGSASTLTKYNTNSSYGTVDSNTQLDLSDDAARANWGGNWRMPTDAEWEELRTKCTWTWTIQNGKKGRLATGPNGNSIFLPAAGRRHGANLDDTGSYGGYWSSSLTTGYPFDAYFVRINIDGVTREYFDRFYGRSIRPVYDEQTSTPIQIPDAHFKAYLLKNYDTDHDGIISTAEADAVTEIKVCTDTIASLKGIEYFKNLTYLSCQGTVTWDADLKKEIINGLLTELDISNNTALTTLGCFGNQLTQLDITHNTALTNLNCGDNQLTSLNISNNSQLRWLRCTRNQLASLNVSNNAALYFLDCSRNQLTELNINTNIELQSLECYENRLSVLNVSSNSKLETLACGYNSLQTLDVRNNRNLLSLGCMYNMLSALNLENNVLLTDFQCDHNQLTSLDVSKLTALTFFGCADNLLTELDVSKLTALTSLYCGKNQLTDLDVSKLTDLTELECSYNYFPSLDVSNNLLLDTLWCYDDYDNPHISEIWLKTGQTIRRLNYISYLTQLKYK